MKKIIVAALAEGNVIGKNGSMPWHIKSELKHFKNTTLNFPIIMGRKTFESFGNGKPLKNRLNIIITRDVNYSSEYEDVKVFNSPEEAFSFCDGENFEKVFIIGGSQIYKQSIEFADEMILSFIPLKVEGDTFFPEINDLQWKIVETTNMDEFIVKRFVRI